MSTSTKLSKTEVEALISGLDGADGAVVVTEWNEFRALTPQLFADLMTGNVLVDLRNIYEPEQMKAVGLNYRSIGRPEA